MAAGAVPGCLIRLLRIREYVDAWAERAASNAAAPGVLPSNVGLDGVVGSAAEGCWYGGCCESRPDSDTHRFRVCTDSPAQENLSPCSW